MMAMAMLNQVLYPVPGFLKGFVAHAFASIVEWDSEFCPAVLVDGYLANLLFLQLYTFVVSCSVPNQPHYKNTDIVSLQNLRSCIHLQSLVKSATTSSVSAAFSSAILVFLALARTKGLHQKQTRR